LPQGWVFTGVAANPNPEGGLVLHGNLLNNTDAPQELQSVNGTFYDGQGQAIAGPDQAYAYWPGYVVPPRGNMPFELLVEGISSAANFQLAAQAQPSSDPPRQDFTVSELNQRSEDGEYCLSGQLRNPGSELADYLIIAAVLYDAQNNVIKFGDYQEFGHDEIEGDTTASFDICVDPPAQEVARYEVVAWGR
jgi:hypothetical protein